MAEEQTVQAEPAEEPQEQLDPETRARREAALRYVRKYGDPVLRSRARPVETFDAAQLGVMHRVLVYRVDREAPLGVLINPELEWAGEEVEPMEEGCLSLPG